MRRLSCRLRDLGALSGDPTDSFWRSVEAQPLVEAIHGGSPAQATNVRSAWGSGELRVLFDCVDRDPWATITKRDGPLYMEEVVEIFVDPVGDLEAYFEIEINPLNSVLDVMLRKSRSGYLKNIAWDCAALRSVIVKTAEGWCAEVSLPFPSLVLAPPQINECWRINFCRIDRPRTGPRELSAWSAPFRNSFHTPERFGILQFAARHAPV